MSCRVTVLRKHWFRALRAGSIGAVAQRPNIRATPTSGLDGVGAVRTFGTTMTFLSTEKFNLPREFHRGLPIQ